MNKDSASPAERVARKDYFALLESVHRPGTTRREYIAFLLHRGYSAGQARNAVYRFLKWKLERPLT
jgi:hypothetical protein